LSGVFGFVCLDSQLPDIHALAGMADAMSYRGPAGVDSLVKGNAALGHLMLRTTEQAKSEQQPWQDPVSKLIISADARLDNRSELLQALGLERSAHNQQFGYPVSDSQLILQCYRQWAGDCVSRLLGDFAFAIWDETRQTLFCARDHMGIKPFYYYLSSAVFAFASAATAVVQAQGVPGRLNQSRVADFLEDSLEGINKTDSFFANVYRLPPAHTLTLRGKNLKLKQYWTPDQRSELHLSSDAEYQDAFAEAFERAVGRRVQGGPVAAMLSGGVDSSAIVGVARDILRSSGGEPLITVSGNSDSEQGCEEDRYIRNVLEQGGINSQIISAGDVAGFSTELAPVFEQMEDPFDSMLTLPAALYLIARSRACVAVLDGVDGDLIASLAPVYPANLLREGKLSRAWVEYRGLCSNYFPYSSAWHVFNRVLLPALVPDAGRRLRTRALRPLRFRSLMRQSILSEDFARKVDLVSRYDEKRREFALGFQGDLRVGHVQRVVPAYLTVAVERYERVAAYCGVEHRKPFLDKEFVEFCISLPWDQKVRDGWSKYSLRKLAEKVVPSQVAWRRGREHVGHEFTMQLMAQQRKVNLQLLTEQAGRLEEFVDMDKFGAIMRAYRAGSDRVDAEIWPLVNLVQWLWRNGF